MRNVTAAISRKVAIVFFMLTIISMSMVGGTFASLSANYVWDSETANTGAFDYADQNFTFSLFGGKDIFPGDSGRSRLSGPNFENNTVTWSFTETNANSIPLIYFVKAKSSETYTYFSSFDYNATLPNLFLKLPQNTYLSTNAIGISSAQFVSKLYEGAELNWFWPANIYTSSANNYQQDTSAATTTFLNTNSKLCQNTFGFTDALLAPLNIPKAVSNIVVGKKSNGYNFGVAAQDSQFSISNNLLYINKTNLVPIKKLNGEFTSTISTVERDDSYYFALTETYLNDFTATATANNIKYSLLEKCDGDGTLNQAGNRQIVKIMPSVIGARASVQVSVVATITIA
ncbi:MAG: hypothetical protein RSC44_01715 [Clostridia bacterium]